MARPIKTRHQKNLPNTEGLFYFWYDGSGANVLGAVKGDEEPAEVTPHR